MDVHSEPVSTRDDRGRTVTLHALPSAAEVARCRAERAARVAVTDPFAGLPVADDDTDGAW